MILLENNFSLLVNYSEELEYYLNFYMQKNLSNKKLINSTFSSNELMRLNDRVTYLKQQNEYLKSENLELKSQLNENILSKFIKKIFKK